MKRVLLSLFLVGFAFFAKSQGISVAYNNDTLNSGDTVTVYTSGEPDTIGGGNSGWEIQFRPVISNLSNRAITAKIDAEKLNETDCYVGSICTSQCVEGYESEPFEIEASGSYTSAYVDFVVPTTASDGLFKVNFYELENTGNRVELFVVTKKSNVGISGTVVPGLKVYPNPTNGMVRIQCENGSAVSIYDIKGAQVHSVGSVSNGCADVDMSGLSKGLYVVCVRQADGFVATQKIVLR